MVIFSAASISAVSILVAAFLLLPSHLGTVGPFQSAAPVITVDSSSRHQMITGWEATDHIGAPPDSQQSALSRYKDPLLDALVDQIGINRLRLEVRSGSENLRDYYSEQLSGQIDHATWRCVRYSTANDDGDPNHINLAGFHFSELDWKVENIVLPLRSRLEARGEKLFLNLNYVAFTSQITGPNCPPALAYNHDRPEEYAEFILATSLHLREKYGVVPDAWQLILEPDNVAQWRSGKAIAGALRAAAARLETAGFVPRFIVPSTTSMAAAPAYFDQMVEVLGEAAVRKYVQEISYHRYTGVNDTDLQRIASRSLQYGIGASMLEWWNPANGYSTLHKDLTMGRNSAWQQGTILGILEVDNSVSDNPRITVPEQTRFLRQYFKFVRAGATRIGASTTNSSFDPVAFVDSTGRRVVVVKAASGGTFSIQGLTAGTYGINYSTGTQYDVSLTDVSVGQGQDLQASIPASGVITVYGKSGVATTPSTSAPTAALAPSEFRLGFKTLADQIPEVVGQPVENERHNPENGDGLQQTTKGLMVWRKADNWTAFTDGSRTWVNGPFGVMERRNEDRFEWEAEF